MMQKPNKSSCLLLMPLAWACSVGPDDPPASAHLPPVARPAYTVGTEFDGWDLISDKAESWKVIAVEGSEFTGETDTGCQFVRGDPILPVLSWDNCGDNAAWRSGTRIYTSAEGSLWPLQVGNHASYEMTWTGNGGETDRGTLDCLVDGTAHITTRAGEHDAYRIVCTQKWDDVSRRRTTYWAPDLGPIKFTDTHSKRGTTESWELVSVEQA